MSLTPELKQAIERSGDAPVRVKDPESDQHYVLIKEEEYLRLIATFEDGLDMRQVGDLVESVMAEDDAEDPLLATYERYR